MLIKGLLSPFGYPHRLSLQKGGLNIKPLIVDNIFFSKHNQHMALTIVVLIKGLLSKFAKLTILRNLALNKRMGGPDLP